ncbi:MAG: calcium-binding protein [Chloroflexi bacterium]|nr:calcium-binding protein [Chloroflexota bacterium]
MKPKLLLTIIALAALITLSLAHAQGAYTPETPATGTTTLVSVDSDGIQGDGWSGRPAISADGRYVAFTSLSNLVPGDTNGTYDIYVHDRQTGDTTRVSVDSDGTQGIGVSQYPVISDDGYIVAFQSYASNLVLNDTNGKADIFVHDTQTGQTTRVNVASDGTQGNHSFQNPGSYAISPDGRYVAFDSLASNLVPGDTNDYMDIYVHDRQTGQTSLVSVASGEPEEYFYSSSSPSISLGGRYVAFVSNASNLVPGDTNGYDDIFVRDTQIGVTSRVSMAYDGTQGNSTSYNPAISADGQYVAFYSTASNLVPGDTNNTGDIFVRNRLLSQTIRVSVASDGTQGDEFAGSSSISADGRYVAFASFATNLVPGDTNSKFDVFVHDTQTGQTSRVSVASDGTQGNWTSGSFGLDISADGRYVAFSSGATNLVPNDTSFAEDVYVHESEANLTINYPDGAPGSYFTVTGSRFPANATATISANGHELGTVLVDASGGFSFIFSTTNADEGIYMITASVNPSATTQLILDAAEPIRPQEGTGSIIDIPGGIAFTNQIFLPLLQR